MSVVHRHQYSRWLPEKGPWTCGSKPLGPLLTVWLLCWEVVLPQVQLAVLVSEVAGTGEKDRPNSERKNSAGLPAKQDSSQRGGGKPVGGAETAEVSTVTISITSSGDSNQGDTAQGSVRPDGSGDPSDQGGKGGAVWDPPAPNETPPEEGALESERHGVRLGRSESLCAPERRRSQKGSSQKGKQPRSRSDVDLQAASKANSLQRAGSTSQPATPEPGGVGEPPQPFLLAQSEEAEPRVSELDLDPPNWREQADPEHLLGLKKTEVKRQEVINELFITEHAHVRMLNVLHTVFYVPLEREKIMSLDELAAIFPGLEDIIEVHNSFYESLKKLRQESNYIVMHIGATLLSRNVDLTQRHMIHEGALTWRVTKEKSVDVQVLLLTDILVLLQKQDDKMVLKCQSKSGSVAQDGKQVLSPIIKLNSVFCREVATDSQMTRDAAMRSTSPRSPLSLSENGGSVKDPEGPLHHSDKEKDSLSEKAGNAAHLLVDFLTANGIDPYGMSHAPQEKVANEALQEGSSKLFTALLMRCLERKVFALCWYTHSLPLSLSPSLPGSSKLFTALLMRCLERKVFALFWYTHSLPLSLSPSLPGSSKLFTALLMRCLERKVFALCWYTHSLPLSLSPSLPGSSKLFTALLMRCLERKVFALFWYTHSLPLSLSPSLPGSSKLFTALLMRCLERKVFALFWYTHSLPLSLSPSLPGSSKLFTALLMRCLERKVFALFWYTHSLPLSLSPSLPGSSKLFTALLMRCLERKVFALFWYTHSLPLSLSPSLPGSSKLFTALLMRCLERKVFALFWYTHSLPLSLSPSLPGSSKLFTALLMRCLERKVFALFWYTHSLPLSLSPSLPGSSKLFTALLMRCLERKIIEEEYHRLQDFLGFRWLPQTRVPGAGSACWFESSSQQSLLSAVLDLNRFLSVSSDQVAALLVAGAALVMAVVAVAVVVWIIKKNRDQTQGKTVLRMSDETSNKQAPLGSDSAAAAAAAVVDDAEFTPPSL
ncbi:UNVERIFIED_CONTAM: hypothetical protein FKN15_076320 [Acipenser sinensis]